MKMNVKKMVGAVAIAGAIGLPAFGLSAGAANAASPTPSIPDPVDTVQTSADPQVQLVDDHGWGGGDHGDWRWGDRGGDRGWGDHHDWDRGGWGWGWRGGWGGWGW